MLPKNSRIPRKMFGLLSKQAKFFGNELFLLRFISNQTGKSRFGFSVSKKVAKKAVVRNRLRRIGYRTISKYIPDIKNGIVALFSYKVVPESKDLVESGIDGILKRAKLINS